MLNLQELIRFFSCSLVFEFSHLELQLCLSTYETWDFHSKVLEPHSLSALHLFFSISPNFDCHLSQQLWI